MGGKGSGGRPRLPLDVRICQHCGRSYVRGASRHTRTGHTGRRFCSTTCAGTANHSARLVERTCPTCGKSFVAIRRGPRGQTWSNNRQRFCSRSCSGRASHPPPVTFSCERCGRAITRGRCSTYYSDALRFCSRKCAAMQRCQPYMPPELDEPIAKLKAAIKNLKGRAQKVA